MKRKVFDAYATAIAKEFHLELDQMFSPARRRDIVDARQMLYYLCMERPIRLSYIQTFMEQNDCPVQHSTILHGYKKAKELIDNDKDYQDIVDSIKETNAV